MERSGAARAFGVMLVALAVGLPLAGMAALRILPPAELDAAGASWLSTAVAAILACAAAVAATTGLVAGL
ncbi:MAG: hypothetical protein ACRDGD_12165, partial [Candidatus Limnocylindria bacterium]